MKPTRSKTSRAKLRVVENEPSETGPSEAAPANPQPEQARPAKPVRPRRLRANALHLKPLGEQVVVITGATSGVGLATARAAAAR